MTTFLVACPVVHTHSLCSQTVKFIVLITLATIINVHSFVPVYIVKYSQVAVVASRRIFLLGLDMISG